MICFCYLHYAASWASGGGYQPEWILTPDQDDPYVSSISADQRTHLFGLATKNKVNGLEERPWYWAAREADPEYRDPGNDSLTLVFSSSLQASKWQVPTSLPIRFGTDF